MITPFIPLIGKAIDLVFPDKNEAARINAAIQQAEINGQLKFIDTQLSAIKLEAQSKHWAVALARPMFLYVMYIMILTAIPAGIFSIWYPEKIESMLAGMELWLAAIPTEMWALFGTGYLGYTVNREKGKAALLGQEQKPGLLGKLFG